MCQYGRHFTREKFVDLEIPVPPKHEQKQIVDFIDRETGQIDTQIVREQKSIELLKEFRTALISEVVTGKIDVRNERSRKFAKLTEKL